MDKIKAILLVLLIGVFMIQFNVNVLAQEEAPGQENQVDINEHYEKARVIKVETLGEIEPGEEQFFQEQLITVEMLTGKHKGQVMEAMNNLSGSAGWDIIVEPGDKVILYITEQNGEILEAYISDMARHSYLSYLIIGFTIVLIVIGGVKGLKSLVALSFTVLAIYKILLPALMKGLSPLPITILVLIGVTLLTMFIIGGLTKKSVAATLGTIGGVVIAGLLALIVGNLAHLTGFATEESRMLLYVEDFTVNMQGLLFSGIIIGALGAIMDVAMSIASSVEEVKRANPRLNTFQLVRAGMNVGRDIMGTMSNTLILAYTGGALPLLMLYMAYNTPGIQIFNTELIATEVVRALAGSIGLIFAVPITALIAGMLAKSSSKQQYNTSHLES